MQPSDDASGTVPVRKCYSAELKLEAVRDFLDNGMSRRDVVVRYGITSESTLKKWVIAYRKLGSRAFKGKRGGVSSRTGTSGRTAFDPLDHESAHRIRHENERLARKLGK